MIASHNTFTYLKPKYWIFRLFSNFWKCQDLDIAEQYKKGVRYFDIRVRWTGKEWRLCHGIVDLQKAFLTLDNLCFWMSQVFPDCQYRLMLERGISEKFFIEIDSLINKYPNLMWIQLKKPWKEIYIRIGHRPCFDYAYERWGWKDCIKSIWKNLIKANRFTELDKALVDKEHIYFADFIE